MSVCKRISLDDQYFIVIFVLENWNSAVGTTFKNKVKITKIIGCMVFVC